MYMPDPDTVAFIVGYMNDSQPEALLEIARSEHPGVTSARLMDLTGTGFTLSLRAGPTATVQSFAWPSPLTRREDIREHLQDLERRAMILRLHRRAANEDEE